MHFKNGLTDRNDERYMRSQRIQAICRVLFDEYVRFDIESLRDMEIRRENENVWRAFDSDKDTWGEKGMHFFFRQTAVIPRRMAGCQVRYAVTPGPNGGWYWGVPQVLARVDGEVRQGLDSNHREIVLTENAQGGEKYDILLDAYCDPFHYQDPLQMRASLICVDTEAEGLYYDITVPLNVSDQLPPDDERRIDMLAVLSDTCSLLDLRQAHGQDFIVSVGKARAHLNERLYANLCAAQPMQVTATGHTHIDVAWKWTYAQTRDKVARSFSTVLSMMDRYPSYRFMSSQPQLYAFLKQDHPEVYEKVRQRVLEGRWEVEGGMWVEADTNLTSGESLVRQFLYGTAFFNKEFGKTCRVLWLPDVFGYSAALPQIMKKCGVDYFMTTKISWNEYDKMPYDTFMWRGIDGTEVLTHFICSRDNELPEAEFLTTYNSFLNPSAVMGSWKRYQQKDLNRDVLLCYGHGDGGGGPEPDMQEQGERMSRGIPGCPQVRFGSVKDYFTRLEADVKANPRLPRWCGELYFEYHRGTYTSMGIVKRLNRKLEYMLQQLECLSVLSDEVTGGRDYPRRLLEECWRTVLLNQFHDVLPGSSIKEVYDEVILMQEQTAARLDQATKDALRRIERLFHAEREGLMVFNPLSFEREDILRAEIPQNVHWAVDGLGKRRPVQHMKDGFAACMAAAPAKGIARLYYDFINAPSAPAACAVSEDLRKIENNNYRMRFDEHMNIVSLVHKASGREAVPEGQRLNRLIAYEDRPPYDQNWNIQAYYREHFWHVDDVSDVRLLENGPVCCIIEVVRHYQNSEIRQQITLYAEIERIDVRCLIDWKEHDTLLKVDFPVGVNAVKAAFDIQFGNIERSTHENTTWDFAQFEVCAHKWADLSQDDYGLAVMNDCKYGYAVKDGHIALTLLKSSCYPNPEADKCLHEITYAILPHESGWREAHVDRDAFSLNCPLIATPCASHGGSEAIMRPFVYTDREDVIVDTVKYAEDNDDIIIRVYENMNRGGSFTLHLGMAAQSARRCNLLEQDGEKVDMINGTLSDTIRPYEILTYRIVRDPATEDM